MVKSGLIFGAAAFILVLGSAIVITPFCAPCLGLILGLAAGYLACVFDKPTKSGESIQKGGIAGAIAAGIGFVGGLLGGVINGVIITPAMIQSFTRSLLLTNFNLSQTQIMTYQLVFAVIVGAFDVVWMAILGVAGGALWFQAVGKNKPAAIKAPEQPISPEL